MLWPNNFLQNRSIQVRVGSALSQPLVLQNGTLQGSVLSPLLFVIMINAIPNLAKGLSFMDDRDLLTSNDNNDYRSSIDNSAKFANGFEISASKSQAVLFTNSSVKRSEAIIRLRIGKEIIPLSLTATFLGIVLNTMRAISESSWGAKKSNLLKVYRATFRSLLDCGCEAINLGCKYINMVYMTCTTWSNVKHWRSVVVAWSERVPRPCKWNAVSFLSIYVLRSSWQTMPLGPPPRKICLSKINILFLMAGSPNLSDAPLQAEETSWNHHIQESRVPPVDRTPWRHWRGRSCNSSSETEETGDRHF